MKRYFSLVVLLVLALIAVACGGSPTTEPQEEATQAPATGGGEATPEETTGGGEEAAGPFRVAVVMPSAINDLAFSQSMYDALVAIQDEMGEDNFQFDYSENMFVVDDAAAAIRDYASEGYDLVIAHGSQYGSALAEIAPDFPETSFAHGTTVDTFTDQGINNVFAYEARSEQGGYVNGVIAASLSESNILGVVGPIETGDAKLYVDGFVAGAKATKPDIEVNVNYIGSFSDVALASEAATTHVNAGADGLTGTAQMVVGAIGVAEENGIPWFGTQSSQTSLAPSVVVANQVYDWTVVIKDIMDKIASGTLGGEAYAITLANDGLVMDYNEEYDLPDDVKALADETVAQIESGDIVVVEGAPAPPAEEEGGGEEGGATGMGGVEGDLVFGVVLVGPANDRGWSQAHAEASSYVEENIPGSQAIIFESLNPADKPEATLEGVVDDMVSQGAQLILTTSDEFEEDTLGVAEKYPDIVFVNVSGDDAWEEGQDYQAPPNLGNFMGRMEDMKAIAGCAAALATETGKIGYLGPLINFETRRLTASAYQGARYCYENYRGLNPDDLQFTVTWIGFWFNIPGVTLDPTEVTNNFIDTGHDVILSGIDTTEAIDVAGQRARQGDQVWAIPYDFENACDNAPDICLGVPYFNWGPAYLDSAQQVIDGTWTQSWEWLPAYWEDLRDNDQTNVGWVNGPALTEEWQASLDEFIAGMASGDIQPWSGPIVLQDGTEYVPEGEVATDQQIWYLPQLLQGMEGPSE
ncbi:MAG TPA: BMP family ABC transporter substrate-binding protein [Candidatus Binatia bacterium]|jgi:basic membrane lipoprotein Med (substrate-binding protein (PBP1-ABC) superfamily)|nr:BMP family ABC transporter substrate-binding protein [Candidatus Binatia bacterium]